MDISSCHYFGNILSILPWKPFPLKSLFYLLRVNTSLVSKQIAGSCARTFPEKTGEWWDLQIVVHKFGCKSGWGGHCEGVSTKAGDGNHLEIQLLGFSHQMSPVLSCQEQQGLQDHTLLCPGHVCTSAKSLSWSPAQGWEVQTPKLGSPSTAWAWFPCPGAIPSWAQGLFCTKGPGWAWGHPWGEPAQVPSLQTLQETKKRKVWIKPCRLDFRISWISELDPPEKFRIRSHLQTNPECGAQI